jgi:alkanesulfonate monooxygenase SsuD/methylene tetrahydromethanopterin reductase-like flavin-dependent oxidoreductase (luciferase family)
VWLGALSDDVVRLAGRIADGWNGWGLAPTEFHRKVQILEAESAEAGRRVDATWAGIVLVGEDEAEASRLLGERGRKGMADGVAWTGETEGFVAHLRALAEAGASWAIVVLAGPADRRELLAERVLPALAISPVAGSAGSAEGLLPGERSGS